MSDYDFQLVAIAMLLLLFVGLLGVGLGYIARGCVEKHREDNKQE